MRLNRVQASALAVFVPLTLLLSACGGTKTKSAAAVPGVSATALSSSAASPASPTPSPGPGSAAQPEATPTPGGPASPVTNAVQSLLALKNFRATISIEAPGHAAQTGQLEAIPPERLHIALGGIEFITIGSDSYTRFGPSWTKQSTAGVTGGFSLSVENLARTAGSFLGRNLAPSGTDTVNGTSCQVYRSQRSEACIDAAGVPLRIVSDQDGTKLTIVLTERNGSVSIQPPDLTPR